MSRYLIEIRTLGDWQSRLGDPEKHWKRRASAMELAIDWTLAAVDREEGLPERIKGMLQAIPGCVQPCVKLAVPELRTALPGGNTSSQTDLWVLLDAGDGFVSLSIEGKAEESFADLTSTWLNTDRSEGKEQRLEYLRSELGLSEADALSIRYQLLHRTVAALIEAREWKARAAVMIVQRFAGDPERPAKAWNDFVVFARHLGVTATPGVLLETKLRGSTPLWIGWLDCPCADDRTVADVLGQSRASLKSQRRGR